MSLQEPPPHNIADSGCGPLRGPPTQPAFRRAELRSQISGVFVAEPGSHRIEAGSESAGSLDGIVVDEIGPGAEADHFCINATEADHFHCGMGCPGCRFAKLQSLVGPAS